MTRNFSKSEDLGDVSWGGTGAGNGWRAEAGLVSVVIPCYNQAHFLGEAIESVLSQSYRAFEVIVVDDGSTDNTSEVASRYAGAYAGVRLIRQENRGLAGARNRGLAEAKGEYVVFLDSDDRLLPDALEVGVTQLEEHPQCAFVSGICRRIAADGSPIPEWKQYPVRDEPYVELLRGCPIYVPAVMYRRSIFETVGAFGTSFGAAEDYDLYYRIAGRFPILCHNTLVAEIRLHDTNMTHDRALMLKSNLTALRSQRKHVRADARYEEAYRAGVRLWRDWYGDPLVEEVQEHLRERRWGRALRDMLSLARYYPQGIALLDERRMERQRLARWLRVRRKELQAHEHNLREHRQRLRALGAGPGDRERQLEEELRNALEEERGEVQRLRRRIRRLGRRIRKLDQQAQNGRILRMWESLMSTLKKAGGVKAKAPQK